MASSNTHGDDVASGFGGHILAEGCGRHYSLRGARRFLFALGTARLFDLRWSAAEERPLPFPLLRLFDVGVRR